MNASRGIMRFAVAVVVGMAGSRTQADDGAGGMEMVMVGNLGNPGRLSGGAGGYGDERVCGSVNYFYRISKFEVTAKQYVEFLNAVAKTDPYGLYNTNMDTAVDPQGCNIIRSGQPGEYSYSVAADWADRPVNFVSWGDAVRFANWVHNGRPVSPQGPATTEDGSYFLDGAISIEALQRVVRKSDATWVIPSEDEWYKASYHKNDGVTGNFWDYPTRSDTVPGNIVQAPDAGNSADYFDDYGVGNGGFSIGAPYFRTPVGFFANSASAYGTFDQGGNVWEWNEAVIRSTARGERGGCFDRYYPALVSTLHAANRNSDSPVAERSITGFRLAEVAGGRPDCDQDGIPDGWEPDQDRDGVPDGCDQCPNTPSCAMVDARGCPTGDGDNDGVFDGCDQCPNSPPGSWVNRNTGCPTARADLDRDGDVDQADFALFQKCFSGPSVPADPNCVN